MTRSSVFLFMKIDIHIQGDLKDTRLDTVIAQFGKTCSRSRAAALISNKDILVNHIPKKPGYKVKPGDLICGIIPEADSSASILPEKIPLTILFEDDHIMVINKKAGMVVHPAPGNLSGTLVNALLYYIPKIKRVGDDPVRAGIVHRLDKDTSGLMVIAKTSQALETLQIEFKLRRVEKKYLALVYGRFSNRSGQIDLPISRHPVKRKLMAVNHGGGKSAITLWEVRKFFKTACLVEATLKTGRTHQIRVHFYAIEHPLVGEQTYRPRRYRKKKDIASRQMLHAWQLSFQHPISGKALFFEADVPEDFRRTQALLESIE